ncbi:AT-hook motif nuclear-localized protein 21-like [Phragmites australis]|uniref:AT-hook motif nuclear-localized protein 21-like n=1 Tax=Phragmites australis TaxID=29695 RepID=UPI002D7796DA|nr:AT-hook motif nuclear-localized protein 21-like [Phragmites australis]
MGMVVAMATSTAARTHQLRQPRSRPAPCSKNRPKPPVVIAHECPSAMRAHILEVPAGRDVLSCVAAFARRGRRGALVLGAVGHVTDVVLREPSLVLRGTMEILSLAGCFFPSPSSAAAGTAVFLAGPRGSVLGGSVAVGGLVAAGPVVVMVATFVAAALDRLPPVKGDVHGRRPCGAGGQPLQQQLCGWALCRKLGAKS